MAISGPTVVVGCPGDTDTAAAYIYTKTSSGWPATPTATLEEPAATSHDNFGGSVAISHKTIVIGASQADGDAGVAYSYVERVSGWRSKPTATLSPPAPASNYGGFGWSAAVSGSTAFIGAFGADSYAGPVFIIRSGPVV
ncbi:MAG: hypothetical protein WAM97_13695 [Acidimicrobiales bacterium]